MFVQFSVANYRSFLERVTLSAVASTDRQHPRNLLRVAGGRDINLLKSLAIYGANASGKSNLIRAMGVMRETVLSSVEANDALPMTSFKLSSKASKRPTELEVVFIDGGERYVYGFSADESRISDEWLTACALKPRARSRLLFRRSRGGAIDFGPSWQGERKRLVKLTRPNALFVSVASQFASPTAKLVCEWFRKSVQPASSDPGADVDASTTRRMLSSGGRLARKVTEFLKVADLGIVDLKVGKQPIFSEQNPERMRKSSPKMAEAIENLFAIVDAEIAEVGGLLKRRRGDAKARANTVEVVRALHRRDDGEDVTFSMNHDESAGTQKLFALTGVWLQAIKDGKLILIDEFDSHLHPLITRFLIKECHASTAGAQLVFTTHDCGLLDAELFRRDQVWFTEKNEAGATDLYSLWDYDVRKVRKDENFRIGYLQGRYGAIPFVGELVL